MSDPSPSPSALDFTHAEPAAPTSEARCVACTRVIHATYYSVNTQLVCPPCHARVVGAHRATGSALDAVLYGLAAAALGAVLYFAPVQITNSEWGIVAIVVGVLVGKGVRKGAGTRSGAAYRALAVSLAYLAIAAAHFGLIYQQGNHLSPVVAFIAALVLPFLRLSRGDGIMGVVILGIALYEAWKFSAPLGLSVSGPFQLAHADERPTISVQPVDETAPPAADEP